MFGTARGLVAAFLLGASIGAAGAVPLLGHRVETLLLEQGRLMQELAQSRSRLEKLESAPQQPQTHVVEDVALEVLWPDEAIRLALVEQLAPLSRELVGREVDNLDPYLVYSVFDGRTVDLAPHRYRLGVRVVVLARETVIILSVTEEETPTVGF